MSLQTCASFLFIWTTIFLQDASGYVISEGKISWLEAAKTQTQTFATPITFSSDTFINLLEDKQEVWVGYFQKTTAFAYVGCVSIDVQHHFSIASEQTNSPGLCLTICTQLRKSKKFVGLSLSKCFCLSDVPGSDIYESGCDLQNSYWVAGDGSVFMSIYETKDIFGPAVTSDKKCLAFDKYSETFWQSCSLPYKSVCKTKNGTYISGFAGQQSLLSWASYIKQCFKNICYPITLEDVQNRPHQLYELATSLTWTRLTQSTVIYGFREFNTTMNISYGYLKRQGEHVNMLFTEDGNVAKRTLFESPDVKESSTSVSRESSTSVSRESSASKTSIGSFASETTSVPIKESQMGQSSSIIVPVGVSSIAVTVVVLVVVLVVLKRRGKIPPTCFRNVQSDSSEYATPEIHRVDQHDYASLGLNQGQVSGIELPSTTYTDYNAIHGNNEHTYSELETHAEASNTDANIESHYYRY
ncbi:uncharacterized protein LOC132737462 [Ruditapes philippinarum]|uniref:uncharacterized protein LOC132737462 n=1 Tax=Ruditapes philippinarum TaxID=129788 RepID=UPI00295BEF49|nr:uncharacterized protein LOC132737462 [Ruditapes philippinarum]